MVHGLSYLFPYEYFTDETKLENFLEKGERDNVRYGIRKIM